MERRNLSMGQVGLVLAGAAAGFAFVAIAGAVCGALMPRDFPGGALSWAAVFGAILGWIGAMFGAFFAMRAIRRKPADPTICPVCDYDLRGSPDESPCPECGATRVPDA